MAFIFVPNADGGFDEGDRQTNDETGVEYIYLDGAWRPLGPKIEDEFDTLDNRYVKLQDTTVLGDYYRLRGPNVAGDGTSTFQVIENGEQKLYNVATPSSTNDAWVANVEYVNDAVSDYLPLTGGTIQGQMYFDVNADGVHNIGIAPRDVDNTSVIYSMNSGICRLRSLAGNNIDSTNVRTHFGWGRNTDGDPETVLYHLKDPTDTTHAANKRYVDNEIADKIGDVDLDSYLPLTGGTLTGSLTLNGGGFYIDSIIKSTRNSGYAIQVKPDDGDAVAFIHTNGNAEFAKVKVENDPVGDTDLANKSYVDTKVAEAATGDIDATGLMTLNTAQTIVEAGTKTIQSLFTFSRGSGEVPVRFLANADKMFEIYYDSDTSTRIDVTEGKEFKVVTTPVDGAAQQVFKTYTNGEIKIEHLKEPTEPHHATRKSYVDARTSPSFRWTRVANSTSAGSLTAGQFFVADNGNIYFHPITADGIDLSVNSTTTGVSSSFKVLASVYTEAGSPAYFITMSEITFNNSSNKYMRLTKSFVHIDDTTVVGTNYHLNIPGFTF